MKTAILTGKSETDLRLLAQLAEKLGIKAKVLNQEDAEDLALIYAIEEGRTDEYIDTDEFLTQLRQ